MNLQDIGIIIAKRPLQERSSIVTLFTKSYGLYSGVIKEFSKKHGSTILPANLVNFSWQARLHEHIGTAKCELIKSYSAPLISNKAKLYAFNSIVSLIRLAFHEREPHNNFFPIFQTYMNNLTKGFDLQDYIRLELAILKESGHGLDLTKCAVTGKKDNLTHVSPKSGKAVSLEAGLPYAAKLLPLPQFLVLSNSLSKRKIDNVTIQEVVQSCLKPELSRSQEVAYNDALVQISALEQKQAFELTTYFLNRYLFNNHYQPESRKVFMEYIQGERWMNYKLEKKELLSG